jgi:hypothetical protein
LIYSAFAALYADRPVLTTRFEKAMTSGAQGPKDFYCGAPKHRLITVILEHARALQDEIFFGTRKGLGSRAFMDLPQICLLGSEDTMICNQTARDVMNRLGIEARVLPGAHGGSLENPESRAELIELLKNPNKIKNPFPKPRTAEPVIIPDPRAYMLMF